jgi:hypothetical protein
MSEETRICSGKYGCGELRWLNEFRVLASGYRATYCHDCELEFDRFRKGFPSRFDQPEEPAGLWADLELLRSA